MVAGLLFPLLSGCLHVLLRARAGRGVGQGIEESAQLRRGGAACGGEGALGRLGQPSTGFAVS